MRAAMSLARWLLAVWAEMPARAASSPAGLASPPASARHMAARDESARRPATNAMLASITEPQPTASGGVDVSLPVELKYRSHGPWAPLARSTGPGADGRAPAGRGAPRQSARLAVSRARLPGVVESEGGAQWKRCWES